MKHLCLSNVLFHVKHLRRAIILFQNIPFALLIAVFAFLEPCVLQPYTLPLPAARRVFLLISFARVKNQKNRQNTVAKTRFK